MEEVMQPYQATFSHKGIPYTFISLERSLPEGTRPASLPYTMRILLENVIRCAPCEERDAMAQSLLASQAGTAKGGEVRFTPSRVLMHDFSIPALVDLAAMREAVSGLGGDPGLINPLVPVAVTIDHSVQVDYFGTPNCARQNSEQEYRLNGERFSLLKWAGRAMDNLTVVPPAKGICHQVQLEHFSRVFIRRRTEDGWTAFPDSMVGADSHTGTLGGIGIVAYGIGGIEVETVMLGEPSVMPVPEIVGVRLTGALRPYVTATDLALHLTAMLRKAGVVEAFVEYTGPGIDALSVPARCTVANMAPEYGATLGFFPVDAEVVRYLRRTGREEQADFVESAARAAGLFRERDSLEPRFARCLELDLSTVAPGIAGPARPQEHIPLDEARDRIAALLEKETAAAADIEIPSGSGRPERLMHGSIALAAITSCTNTINPELIIGAGLTARNAVQRGLRVPGHVKTVLAPGSTTVTRYLKETGLLDSLERLGFYTAGYSCLTCIGNSGPLPPEVEKAVKENGLNVAAVLSANRNFSGRVHPLIRSNFLASPMLVVAYALAGTMRIDMNRDPLGKDADGQPVYLRDILPSDSEIREAAASALRPDIYREEYAGLMDGGPLWEAVPASDSPNFVWDPDSTYIRRPPYFDGLGLSPEPLCDIIGARALALFGDAVTTDHISPAGKILPDSPAGRYLLEHGISEENFNIYGTRRGNHEVMVRGTFANIRLKNLLVAPREGGWTRIFPENTVATIFDASEHYRAAGIPLVVIAGKEYGTGSSRDWAAKGVYFLGVRAILARSFERIHRANLVGMGILPLQFREGESAQSLGLTGTESFTITGLGNITAGGRVSVEAETESGEIIRFSTLARLDTPSELACWRNGGILPLVMRKLISS